MKNFVTTKRYGWKKSSVCPDGTTKIIKHEFHSCDQCDVGRPRGKGWIYYETKVKTPRKGKPLWWAIKQLQAGLDVCDQQGLRWTSFDMKRIDMLKAPRDGWMYADEY